MKLTINRYSHHICGSLLISIALCPLSFGAPNPTIDLVLPCTSAKDRGAGQAFERGLAENFSTARIWLMDDSTKHAFAIRLSNDELLQARSFAAIRQAALGLSPTLDGFVLGRRASGRTELEVSKQGKIAAARSFSPSTTLEGARSLDGGLRAVFGHRNGLPYVEILRDDLTSADEFPFSETENGRIIDVVMDPKTRERYALVQYEKKQANDINYYFRVAGLSGGKVNFLGSDLYVLSARITAFGGKVFVAVSGLPERDAWVQMIEYSSDGVDAFRWPKVFNSQIYSGYPILVDGDAGLLFERDAANEKGLTESGWYLATLNRATGSVSAARLAKHLPALDAESPIIFIMPPKSILLFGTFVPSNSNKCERDLYRMVF